MASSSPQPPQSQSLEYSPSLLQTAEVYQCPVCRSGQLRGMALMDAFSCDFCRHIFEANLEQQTVHLADGTQRMGWRWQGRRWQTLHRGNGVTPVLWMASGVLVGLPTGLVALGAYIFPPLEDSPGSSLPFIWCIATLSAHSLMVLWLWAEHYQMPSYIAARVWLNRRRQRLGN